MVKKQFCCVQYIKFKCNYLELLIRCHYCHLFSLVLRRERATKKRLKITNLSKRHVQTKITKYFIMIKMIILTMILLQVIQK